ncbi:MAG TPA: DNA polymerase III subunit delta' [Cellvibrionaceae bacterium]|nr:DNA polymerase III subunit delta' [Cellvibrionaceae bacterium]HMW49096.1 DNA polymerase III subunit delta' [Cellvibrionaceae bacterium]HNG59233.1 DNA polymerase III subunit delta' [Cellvibrionaceae bacterium]
MVSYPTDVLPWLQPIWQQLTQMMQLNRLPAGLLLTAAEGVGAAEFARAFARILLCEAPREMNSCGVCAGCLLLANHNHPDIFILSPEEDSKVIKIAQIRALNEFIANTAQQSGRKVVVIDPADAMNINAANALLKNLEEPIGQTYFILVSVNPSRLLATIKSRCTRIALPTPLWAEGLAWLNQQGIEAAEAKLASAHGAPLRVVKWQQEGYFDQCAALAGHLEQYLTARQPLSYIAKPIAQLGVALVLDQCMAWVHSALVQPFKPQTLAVASLAELDEKDLLRLYESLQQKKRLLLAGVNLNAQLVVEELLVELGSLFKLA